MPITIKATDLQPGDRFADQPEFLVDIVGQTAKGCRVWACSFDVKPRRYAAGDMVQVIR